MYDYVARSFSLQELHAKSRQQGSYRRRVSNARPFQTHCSSLRGALAKNAKDGAPYNRTVKLAPPSLGRESVAAATDLRRCRPIAVGRGTTLALTWLVSRTMDQRLG
jgi:hypothetical protein